MSSGLPSPSGGNGDDSSIAEASHGSAGSHRAARRAPKERKNPLRRVPVPAILGVAALVAAGIGVVHTTADPLEETFTAEPASLAAPMAMPTYARANSPEVSRSISRATLEKQAETQARQREAALKQLASKSEDHADELLKEQKRKERLAAEREAAEDDGLALSGEAPDDGAVSAGQWVLPVAGYTLTATFGETSSYWETYHTGLDFAAASGTPLVAVTSGTITSTGYDGAYGNKTVLTLDDGTEIWYCHQTSISVSTGQTVSPGEQIGTVGATGNVTGPHLHLEVRPGGGDPVDPYTTLQEHGVNP